MFFFSFPIQQSQCETVFHFKSPLRETAVLGVSRADGSSVWEFQYWTQLSVLFMCSTLPWVLAVTKRKKERFPSRMTWSPCSLNGQQQRVEVMVVCCTLLPLIHITAEKDNVHHKELQLLRELRHHKKRVKQQIENTHWEHFDYDMNVMSKRWLGHISHQFVDISLEKLENVIMENSGFVKSWQLILWRWWLTNSV